MTSVVTFDVAHGRVRMSAKVARYVTIALAGVFGAIYMLWTWRVALGVPLELGVPVHMNDQGFPVRPWAPMWIPVSILTILAILLWRALAVRHEQFFAWRGALAFTLVVLIAYPAAFLCLELGAAAQFYPQPSPQRILAVLPLMLVGSLSTSIMIVTTGGFVALPIAALIGVANAGVGKLISWGGAAGSCAASR